VYACEIASQVYGVPFLVLPQYIRLAGTLLAKNHNVGIWLVFIWTLLGDELPTFYIHYTVSFRSSLMPFNNT
jgi:hypothetical protein